VYIFFGGEEVGLWDSTHFVNNFAHGHPDNLVMMINADVLFEGSYLFYSSAYGYDGYQPR